jgi:quinol monooxygenase YgiN
MLVTTSDDRLREVRGTVGEPFQIRLAAMIVRILTARVPREKAGRFEAVLRAQLPLMRSMDGLVYVKLARQAHATYDDVLLFEEWRDAAALYGWAGTDVSKPRLVPGAESLAEYVTVTHYEALDSVVATSAPATPPDATRTRGATAPSGSDDSE